MSIVKKIEAIRQKPENVRMRYIWIFVTITMTFVVVLWIFSLQDSMRTIMRDTGSFVETSSSQNTSEMQSLQDILQQSQQPFSSMEDKSDTQSPQEIDKPREDSANIKSAPPTDNGSTWDDSQESAEAL